jgi:DNA polymerase-1
MFLIDGSAIFYRSYFAFIRNPLINSKGENTSATFGFLSTLFKLIEDERPDYLSIIFDTKEPTFRHELYSKYKATREKMPEEMSATYPRMIEALQTLNMNLFEMAGYEADDLIATFARRFESEDLHIFIVSGDKDLAQLVNDQIFIYASGKSTTQGVDIMDREGVQKKFGVSPEAITDYLALVGDKSDNVPGIPSVGEKTAAALLSQFKSLEDIIAHSEQIERTSLKEKIDSHIETARLSKQLVTLDSNVPIEATLDDLTVKSWDQKNIEVLLKDMEFNRLVTRAANVRQLVTFESGKEEQKKPQEKGEYHLIQNNSQFGAFLKLWQNYSFFVFDLETDSLDVFTAEIAGIAISLKENHAYYIAINHPDSDLKQNEVFEKIKPIFENKTIKKMAQNIKFDTMILRQHGICPQNLYFDTMVAAYLVDSSTSGHSLDNLAQEYLNYKTIKIEEIIGSGKNQKKMTELPAGEVYTYACEDADITLRLKSIFEQKLKDLELEELFYDLEMPLVPVLIEMEEYGVQLDTKLLSNLSIELTQQISRLQTEIIRQAGVEFNINSPQQLGEILFDRMEIHKELEMRKPKRTKTGQYSTSEQVLERYQRHDMPKKILLYRRLTKLKNTYVDALPGLIHEKSGKVHTSFNQTVAATGRLSSVNPNLQNIPIRTDIGREMRKAFIPSAADKVIMSADYSQIELRIMAHLSSDDKMNASFREDLDIHAATAAQILKIPLDQVDEEARRKAKAINFGIIFGMSKYGLSNRLEITIDEAEEFILGYFATYPKVQEFMRNTILKANTDGYVRTMKGRIRYLPQIHSSNRQLREFAERTSINTPIQGSAADLIKIAMIQIHAEMQLQNLSSKMILQVHDELVFEVPNNEIAIMEKLVKSKMEGALKLSIPIKVDVGIGNNWLEAH